GAYSLRAAKQMHGLPCCLPAHRVGGILCHGLIALLSRLNSESGADSNSACSLAPLALGHFLFQKGVDLVFEPSDRICAEIDVQGEFFGRLKPGDMHARPGDPALSEGLIIEQSSAGLFPGDFGARHVSPRSLMSRGVYL